MSGHTGWVEIPRVGPLAQDSANAICREKTWKKEISTCQGWHLWEKAPISQNIAKYQMVRMAIWVQELKGCRVRRSGCRPVQLKCFITQACSQGKEQMAVAVRWEFHRLAFQGTVGASGVFPVSLSSAIGLLRNDVFTAFDFVLLGPCGSPAPSSVL